jgi:hypothetical protein
MAVAEDDRIERFACKRRDSSPERRSASAVAMNHADPPSAGANDFSPPVPLDDVRAVVIPRDGFDRREAFERCRHIERRQITAVEN